VPVHALAGPGAHFALRTNAVQSLTRSTLDGEELIVALRRLAGSLESAATLMPCTDNSAATVSEYRTDLTGLYRFVLPTGERLQMLLDKARFAEHAERSGLPIPPTIVVGERADARRAAHLRFPLVLKPARKTREWLAVTSTKAFRIENERALLETVDRFLPLGIPLVVQEWVEGGDTALYTVNA
jgi:predicted ATP-grasp superfamily ATP-dependent carboligase